MSIARYKYLKPPQSRIILALDTPDKTTGFKLLESCRDYIDAIKVNYPLILTEGIKVIKEIRENFEIPVIADLKIADVSVTNKRIVGKAIEFEASMVLVHGFIGISAVQDLVTLAEDKIGIVVVTEMTYTDPINYTREFAEDFAHMAIETGCHGIQAPGTDSKQVRNLRNIVGEEMLIISCGIGVQGGDFKNVIEAGADFGIIGRSIYDSPDPKKSAIQFSRFYRADEPSK